MSFTLISCISTIYVKSRQYNPTIKGTDGQILPTLRPYLSTIYVEMRQVGTPTMKDTVPSRSTSSAKK